MILPFTFESVYGTLQYSVLKINDECSVKIHRKAETLENKGFLDR